ncbi:MAG: amino acid ABC transporter substrate-binding protein, partial [Desulfobacteraceae bacterium]|nr:amino acid ABC transporter substrate-binding protein [Desulfobacteraceae bacterium]
MKRSIIFLVIIFCMCSFLFYPSKVSADTKKITIVADEWFPYNGVPGSNNLGFLIDIAVTIFKEKGYLIDYQTKPWNRAISDTRNGKYDAIVGAFKEDAPDFVFPDIELGVSKSVFWVKKGATWKYEGMKSLDNVTVGVIKDYSYGEEFDKYIEKYQGDSKRVQIVFGDDALPQNIRKTIKGRIGTFIEDMMVCKSELKNLKFSDEISSAGQLSVDNVYIAFSPKIETSKAYAKILSEGVEKL